MPSDRAELEVQSKEIRSQDPSFDDPPAFTWTCVMGNDKYLGETRKAMDVQYDIWYSEDGERKHTQYTGPMSKTDITYETDSKWNKPVNQRSLVKPNSEYKVFQGTFEGKPAEFLYSKHAGKIDLSVEAANKTTELKPGSADYEDAIAQMNGVKFDPPCPNPKS